jgi:copper homeostasis protein
MEGKNQLKKLVSLAGNRITIMAGSGVKSSNIEVLYTSTQVRVFHASARKSIASTMQYHHLSMNEKNEKISIDEEEVRLLRKALDKIFA